MSAASSGTDGTYVVAKTFKPAQYFDAGEEFWFRDKHYVLLYGVTVTGDVNRTCLVSQPIDESGRPARSTIIAIDVWSGTLLSQGPTRPIQADALSQTPEETAVAKAAAKATAKVAAADAHRHVEPNPELTPTETTCPPQLPESTTS